MDLGLVHQIPFSHPRPAPAAAANAEIRGVGIKFGERLDPSGGIKVFVKRLVNDSPAHRCGLISPGDVLVLLDGEDVYGWGLAWLRNKIPGPAGTWVRLGFRGAGGGLFEVPLCRTAYGSACTTYCVRQMSYRCATCRPQTDTQRWLAPRSGRCGVQEATGTAEAAASWPKPTGLSNLNNFQNSVYDQFYLVYFFSDYILLSSPAPTLLGCDHSKPLVPHFRPPSIPYDHAQQLIRRSTPMQQPSAAPIMPQQLPVPQPEAFQRANVSDTDFLELDDRMHHGRH